uniref:Uncharacterized protein n=1 Tax=Anguilla anguilla TaxID=7936 RepID=A0A0E9Q4T2_ANGAN
MTLCVFVHDILCICVEFIGCVYCESQTNPAQDAGSLFKTLANSRGNSVF